MWLRMHCVTRLTATATTSALVGMSWTKDVTGALTVQVMVQFVNLYQWLQGIHLNSAVTDRLEW
jgi:hypothetical protein